jgi:hypothetical protein
VKPKGNVIFEMPSMDYVSLESRVDRVLHRTRPRKAQEGQDKEEKPKLLRDYENVLYYRDLRRFLETNDTDVHKHVFDLCRSWLSNNRILRGPRKFNAVLSSPLIFRFLLWAEVYLFGRLPTQSSYYYMVVARKR